MLHVFIPGKEASDSWEDKASKASMLLSTFMTESMARVAWLKVISISVQIEE